MQTPSLSLSRALLEGSRDLWKAQAFTAAVFPILVPRLRLARCLLFSATLVALADYQEREIWNPPPLHSRPSARACPLDV